MDLTTKQIVLLYKNMCKLNSPINELLTNTERKYQGTKLGPAEKLKFYLEDLGEVVCL